MVIRNVRPRDLYSKNEYVIGSTGKRVGFKLAQKDVFLNIAGGLKVNDPAIGPGGYQRYTFQQYGYGY